MRVRAKAVWQFLGIMAALWLLPLPGILLVAIFSGWTQRTAEMAKGLYLLFAFIFAVTVTGGAYTYILICALPHRRGRSFIRGISYLAGTWLSVLFLRTFWHGLEHVALSSWDIFTGILAAAHFVVLHYAKQEVDEKT